MRNPTNICLLCREKKASKRNSHIIPKFMGQGIFDGIKPRHGIMLTNSEEPRKIQDIPKEDYLFCENCEKGFSIIETYCSWRLERYNKVNYLKHFNHEAIGGIKYVEFKDLDIRIFNLFIYSIIWRVSISNNYFQKVKLQNNEEEKLRTILKQYSSSTQNDLLNSISNLKILPEHSHVIFRPVKKLRPPASMLSAGSYNDWMYQIHLVDYVLIYLTDNSQLINELRIIDNNRVENLVRIGLVDKDSWESFNFKSLDKALTKEQMRTCTNIV